MFLVPLVQCPCYISLKIPKGGKNGCEHAKRGGCFVSPIKNGFDVRTSGRTPVPEKELPNGHLWPAPCKDENSFGISKPEIPHLQPSDLNQDFCFVIRAGNMTP